MLNAAYSADKAKNVDKAIFYYNKVIENAANSNINIHKERQENLDDTMPGKRSWNGL